MLLFNLFSNRLDDFFNTFDNENIINCCLTRNAISPPLLGTGKNRVIDCSKIKKGALGRNRVAGHSKMK